MSEHIEQFDIYVPSAPGALPNETFDWNVFIREAHLGIANMKVLGTTEIRNMAQYDTIQEAIDELDVLGGGLIYFPAGTYLIEDPIVLTDNITLLGADGAIISTGDEYTISDMVQISGKEEVSIINLAFRGYGIESAQCLTNGINIANSARIHIFNCRFLGMGDTGVIISQVDAPPDGGNRIYLRDCLIDDYNGNGVEITGASQVEIVGCKIERDAAMTPSGVAGIIPKGHAIQYTPGIGVAQHDIRILHCTVLTPRRNHIYCPGKSGNCAFVRVLVQSNSFYGGGDASMEAPADLYLRGSGIWLGAIAAGLEGYPQWIIKDNNIEDVLFYGFYLGSRVQHTTIDGNRLKFQYQFHESGGVTYHTKHVYGPTLADRTMIVGNRFQYIGTTSFATTIENMIELGGSNQIISGNEILYPSHGVSLGNTNHSVVTGNTFVASGDGFRGITFDDNSTSCIAGFNVFDHPAMDRDGVVFGNASTGCYAIGNNLPVNNIGGDGNDVAFNHTVDGTDHIMATADWKINKLGWLDQARKVTHKTLYPRSWGLVTATAGATGAGALGNVPAIVFPDGLSVGYAYIYVPFEKVVADSSAYINIKYRCASTPSPTETVYMTVSFSNGTAPYSVSLTLNASTTTQTTRITVPSTAIAENTWHRIEINRDPTNGSDVYADNFYVIGAELKFKEQLSGDDADETY